MANNNFAGINLDLKLTQQNIERLVTEYDIPLKHYLTEFANSKGKLIRPTLFYLFKRTGNNKVTLKDQAAATSIELLHMATLIHDDIIDDSPLRRGVASIQAKFGKDVAVYSGDYLFTLFFKLLVNELQDMNLIKLNVETMYRILRGELNQKAIRFDLRMDMLAYLDSIYGKTAAIFGLACYEGTVLGGQSEVKCKLARKIGYHIGIVFQIHDDILDYTASIQTAHKPVLKDLSEGIYTLPLILAFKDHENEFLPILNKKSNLTSADEQKIVELIQKHQGIEKATTFANKYIQKTQAELKCFGNAQLTNAITKLFDKLQGRSDLDERK
ncbi:polyprenyl synthetase family protein [Ligilactobacillus sp. LYQ135]